MTPDRDLTLGYAAVVRLTFLVVVVGCSSSPGSVDAPSAPWTAITMPRAALEPGVAALGTRIVMLGGFDTGLEAGLHITTSVDVYDTLAASWSILPAAPVAWTHVDLASSAGTLYLLGGTSGQEFTAEGAAYKLEVGGDAWLPIAPLPTGMERGAAGVVVSPPHIFLIGGASTTSALASCLDYNLMTDTWSMLPDLPAARSHPAAMRRADDGELIVAGGLATLDASQPQRDVWSLATGATAWVAKAPMPTPRGGCAYGPIGGHLLCAGGEANQAALHVVEEYEPSTDTWAALPDIPMARAGTQGVVVGEQLYIPGGAQQLKFEPTDQLYVFRPLN